MPLQSHPLGFMLEKYKQTKWGIVMMKKILARTTALAMLTAVETGCGSDEESSKEAVSAATT